MPLTQRLTPSLVRARPTGTRPTIWRRLAAGVVAGCLSILWLDVADAQTPTPTVVESPNVKVLTGLTAPVFQDEMNHIVEALGVTCGTCHVRGNFASEDNPLKVAARRMLELTRTINKAYFPDYRPKESESVLGRVTCYTCHKGEQIPKERESS